MGTSGDSCISADGRYVAFMSLATNLVLGDMNSARDIFVRDRMTGVTTRVSVNSAGIEAMGGGSFAPSISSNGRFIAFESFATNLVPGDSNGEADVFMHDRMTGLTTRVSVDSAGSEADSWSQVPGIAR